MDDTRNYTSERRLPSPRDTPGMFEMFYPLPEPSLHDPVDVQFMDF